MLINSLILAISSSIDSLSIGLTYGIKGTKITFISQFILSFISIFTTTISILLGNLIKEYLTDTISKIIGSGILIFLGILIIIQTKKEKESYDFNHSNIIDPLEALALGIALSLDSICIGIGGSVFGLRITLFPILVTFIQLLFLNLGNIFGNKLLKLKHFSSTLCSLSSGILLILIGSIKLIF